MQMLAPLSLANTAKLLVLLTMQESHASRPEWHSLQRQAKLELDLKATTTPYCYKIVTGSGNHNDGTLSAQVSAGSAVVQAASGSMYSKGDVVNSSCFTDPIAWIKVLNPTNNAWGGSVEYSTDGGDTFSAMVCSVNCNNRPETGTHHRRRNSHMGLADITVDGNDDAGNQAFTTCLNGQECTLTPPETPYCYKIVTGSGDNNDGTLSAQVSVGTAVVQAASGSMYSKGDVVNSSCFADPIAWIKVSNPTNNAWGGSAEYSTDGGDTFSSMVCSVNCNDRPENSDLGLPDIYVDGNDNANRASSLCLNGQECTLTPHEETTTTEAPTPSEACGYTRQSIQPLGSEWEMTALNQVCKDPESCGSCPDGGRCRDFGCSRCGSTCTTREQAQDCCLAADDCTAVYGGGEHWWTFHHPCEEVDHENEYTVWQRTVAIES